MKAIRLLCISVIVYVCQCQEPQCPDVAYFGPSCLFRNLRYNGKVQASEAADKSDGSICLDIPNENQKVQVFMPSPRKLTWIRINVKHTNSASQVKITLLADNGNEIEMSGERRVIENTTVDVQFEYPKVGDLIASVEVQGDIQSTCDIYVAYGQILSLQFMDKASMNAESREDGLINAAKCVDRDFDSYCEGSREGDDIWWQYDFAFPAKVNFINLFNEHTDSSDMSFSENHRVYMYDEKNEIIWEHGDDEVLSLYHYTLEQLGPEHFPVARFQVVNVKNSGDTAKILYNQITLWGDFMCEGRTFGAKCEKACNCLDTEEICFKNSGGCPSGCAYGYHGTDCLEPCPPNTFGHECSQDCSGCLEGCDHVYGTCEKCPDGKYGVNCKDPCPENCLQPLCDPKSGACADSQCKPLYLYGPHCNETCPQGLWGETCETPCSENCAGEGDCDVQSGECNKGCKNDYMPPLCTGIKEGSSLLPLLIGLIILLLLLIAAFLLLRKKDEPPQGEENE